MKIQGCTWGGTSRSREKRSARIASRARASGPRCRKAKHPRRFGWIDACMCYGSQPRCNHALGRAAGRAAGVVVQHWQPPSHTTRALRHNLDDNPRTTANRTWLKHRPSTPTSSAHTDSVAPSVLRPDRSASGRSLQGTRLRAAALSPRPTPSSTPTHNDRTQCPHHGAVNKPSKRNTPSCKRARPTKHEQSETQVVQERVLRSGHCKAQRATPPHTAPSIQPTMVSSTEPCTILLYTLIR